MENARDGFKRNANSALNALVVVDLVRADTTALARYFGGAAHYTKYRAFHETTPGMTSAPIGN